MLNRLAQRGNFKTGFETGVSPLPDYLTRLPFKSILVRLRHPYRPALTSVLEVQAGVFFRGTEQLEVKSARSHGHNTRH